jgi:hypothetical protein
VYGEAATEKSGKSDPPLLLRLAPLSSVTPLRFLQLFASSSGDLAKMFAQVDARFIRGACQQSDRWKGLPADLGLSDHRIHGANDKVIPCPADADLILPGGHLITMTQAAACAEFAAALFS